ncbi:MAG: hypothetical protein WCK96_09445 [Methylococcales bacterium]
MNLLSYHEAKQQAEGQHQAILQNHPNIISKAYNKVLNTEGDKGSAKMIFCNSAKNDFTQIVMND